MKAYTVTIQNKVEPKVAYILNNDTPPWAKASVRFIDVALEYLYE